MPAFWSNLGREHVGSFAAHYKEPRDVAYEIPALVRDVGKYHDLVRSASFLIRKLYRDVMETRSSPGSLCPSLLHHPTVLVREQQVRSVVVSKAKT